MPSGIRVQSYSGGLRREQGICVVPVIYFYPLGKANRSLPDVNGAVVFKLVREICGVT